MQESLTTISDLAQDTSADTLSETPNDSDQRSQTTDMSHSFEAHSSPVPTMKKKAQDFDDFFMKQMKSLDAADKSDEF